MIINRILLFLSALLLTACSSVSDKPIDVYQLADMRPLQQQKQWYFEGRLALADERDSISASVNWRHGLERDDIEFTGPLAQGRLLISVVADTVIVDDGDKRQEFRGPVEDVLAEQLGVVMPVNALRYWVLGVVDPRQQFIEWADGFMQAGWRVSFKEMQRVNAVLLPRKINAEKDKTRIKLVVDQWDLS